MIRYVLSHSVECSIVYQSESDITQRRIKIYRMEADRVYAYCFLREQQRVFKIENILAAFPVRYPDFNALSHYQAGKSTGLNRFEQREIETQNTQIEKQLKMLIMGKGQERLE